jgi:hypothetical protein
MATTDKSLGLLGLVVVLAVAMARSAGWSCGRLSGSTLGRRAGDPGSQAMMGPNSLKFISN